MRTPVYLGQTIGFSLIETMLALAVLTFGLLATAQLLYVTATSRSLERSKGTAAVTAQNILESLGSLYQRNPSAADFSPGNHGPRQIEVINPVDGITLNLYSATWSVDSVPDPRPGKALNAKLVRTTITPVRGGGADNSKAGFNKILSVSTVFSPVAR